MSRESSNIVLSLSTEDAFIHKDFYENGIRSMVIESEQDNREILNLMARIEARDKRIKKYKEYLERINGQLNIDAPKIIETTTVYDPKWSLAQKAKYVLTKAGQELTTRSIVESILAHEPKLLENKEITFDRLQKNLGSTLLQKVANNIVFYRKKVRPEDNEYLYGLNKWQQAQM